MITFTQLQFENLEQHLITVIGRYRDNQKQLVEAGLAYAFRDGLMKQFGLQIDSAKKLLDLVRKELYGNAN